MSRGENNENDWPEYKRLVIQNMEDCREQQDKQRSVDDSQNKQIAEAHQQIKWIKDRMMLIASAVSGGATILIMLLKEFKDQIFK